MASVPLHALKMGADKIPDKAFEKIPIVGRKYFREDKKRHDRKHRHDRSPRDTRESVDTDSGSDSEGSYSRYNRSRAAPRRYERSRRDSYESRDYDRGYASDPPTPRSAARGATRSGPRGYDETPQFDPPPRIALNDNELGQHTPQGTFVPKKYNPNDYNASPGTRDDYFTGHPLETAPYSPYSSAAPSPLQAPPSQASTSQSNGHSAAANRYTPSNYQEGPRGSSSYSRSQQRGRSSDGGYENALALRRPSPEGYSRYSPPQYTPEESEDEERDRKSRRSKSRSSFRDKSRSASLRVKEEFGKHKKEVGTASIGAIAGGLLGNAIATHMSGGHKKKSSKSNVGGILVGAALGGLGAAAFENRREKSKEKRLERESQSGYDSY